MSIDDICFDDGDKQNIILKLDVGVLGTPNDIVDDDTGYQYKLTLTATSGGDYAFIG